MKSTVALMLIAGITALSGCGTVGNVIEKGGNHEDFYKVYGGVGTDLETVRDCIITWKIKEHPLLTTSLVLVDLPFSAVGDTLTLPWTLAHELNKPVDMPPEPLVEPPPHRPPVKVTRAATGDPDLLAQFALPVFPSH
jgi:uncharacterized protein YceK